MVTLHADITDLVAVANQQLSSSTNKIEQYRQSVFAFHTWMQAMGYGVVASSDGVTNPPVSGNLILSSSNIVHGLTTVEPHTWIVYREPGSGSMYITADCSVTSSNVNPDVLLLYRSSVEYNISSSLTRTTRPPAILSDRETSVLALAFPGWGSAPVSSSYSYVYSVSEGGGYFFTKRNGTSDLSCWIVVDRPASDDAIQDGLRSRYIGGGAASTTLVTTAFRAGAYDSTAGQSLTGYTFGGINSWPSGQASDLRQRLFPIIIVGNVSQPEDTRLLGSLRFIRYVVANTSHNIVDAQDPISDLWEWRTCGSCALLWRKSNGNIV